MKRGVLSWSVGGLMIVTAAYLQYFNSPLATGFISFCFLSLFVWSIVLSLTGYDYNDDSRGFRV